jgi:hypothetical protein
MGRSVRPIVKWLEERGECGNNPCSGLLGTACTGLPEVKGGEQPPRSPRSERTSQEQCASLEMKPKRGDL